VGVQLALVTLNQTVKRADAAAKVAGEQREYHKILAKFNKTIEKVPYISSCITTDPLSLSLLSCWVLSCCMSVEPHHVLLHCKQFPMNITKAYRDIDMDKVQCTRTVVRPRTHVHSDAHTYHAVVVGGRQDLMNEVIAEHLYREGFVETARTFENETGVEVEQELKQPLQELHTILCAIRQHDMQPAIL
jgi:hypothetical protein